MRRDKTGTLGDLGHSLVVGVVLILLIFAGEAAYFKIVAETPQAASAEGEE